MKVLHFAHGFFPESSGGVESYVRTLLHGQRARGLDARLLTGSFEPRARVEVEELELEGVPSRRVHRDDLYFDHFAKLWHPGVERVVADLLAAERPDLVHVHHWIRLTGNLVELAAAAGVPAVVTLHDVYTSCPRCFRVDRDGATCERPLGTASCRTCVPRFGHESEREIELSIAVFAELLRSELDIARAVLVADPATAALLEDAIALPRARLDVLPMPRREAWRSDRSRSDEGEPFRFGHWGTLAPHKGVDDLVRAFAKISGDADALRSELHVFGPFATPAFERELRELAAGLPVAFHGRFVPADLERHPLDAAVFPSRAFETWSFVLDEAFDLGLPVVVSDVGAPATRASVRVRPGDVDGLASAMRRLRDDPAARRDAATSRARGAASVDDHLAALEAVYGRVRAAGAPAAFSRSDPLRRAELLQLQRESAQGRIVPDGGPR